MKFGLIVAALAVLAAFAFADTVSTTVWFNVPSDITFTVTIPGKGAVAGSTTDIEYNATVPTITKVNCTVREGGGQSQTALVPCFNYTNTGNRAINITLQFGSALPTGVTVKAGHNNSAWLASCTCTDLVGGCPLDDCVVVPATPTTAVKVANIPYASYKDVWMWADYASYMGGAGNSRALSHTSETG
jgi:hypothetical protein